MKDRTFIDTNIFVYAFLSNKENREEYDKHLKAKVLLEKFKCSDLVFISTQVCNEYYSALLKNKIVDDDIQNSINRLINTVQVVAISKETFIQCFEIRNRYGYSYWDSLILSSTLENHCTIVYSEDMQSGQIIQNTLCIVNPFTVALSRRSV